MEESNVSRLTQFGVLVLESLRFKLDYRNSGFITILAQITKKLIFFGKTKKYFNSC
jgi:hypothetical protein